MSSASDGVTVKILDREYQINCPEEERQALLSAAQYLDDKMREMRKRNHNIGVDKLAVITALNIAYEIRSLQPAQASLQKMQEKLLRLNEDVSNALSKK